MKDTRKIFLLTFVGALFLSCNVHPVKGNFVKGDLKKNEKLTDNKSNKKNSRDTRIQKPTKFSNKIKKNKNKILSNLLCNLSNKQAISGSLIENIALKFEAGEMKTAGDFKKLLNKLKLKELKKLLNKLRKDKKGPKSSVYSEQINIMLLALEKISDDIAIDRIIIKNIDDQSVWAKHKKKIIVSAISVVLIVGGVAVYMLLPTVATTVATTCFSDPMRCQLVKIPTFCEMNTGSCQTCLLSETPLLIKLANNVRSLGKCFFGKRETDVLTHTADCVKGFLPKFLYRK